MPPGRLRGELTEFAGRRAELALVRQALLLGGRAGGLLGRKKIFITGLLVFSAASACWPRP